MKNATTKTIEIEIRETMADRMTNYLQRRHRMTLEEFLAVLAVEYWEVRRTRPIIDGILAYYKERQALRLEHEKDAQIKVKGKTVIV